MLQKLAAFLRPFGDASNRSKMRGVNAWSDDDEDLTHIDNTKWVDGCSYEPGRNVFHFEESLTTSKLWFKNTLSEEN